MHLSFRALLFEWFCGSKFVQLGINVRLHAHDLFRTGTSFARKRQKEKC